MGHLRCAQEILEDLNLNRIIFIPASQPPHKTREDIGDFNHRKAMVRLAIEKNPSFVLSDIEGRREGNSYSVETIRHFLEDSKANPELYFIIGQDAFHNIETWKEWKRALLLCNFIVMTRPGYKVRFPDMLLPKNFSDKFAYEGTSGSFKGPTGFHIYFRTVTLLAISSTTIREKAKHGQSIRYLVPDAVGDYISQQHLYKDP
jgi:nicotinate-nucleotide adenylyltransferase